MTRLLVFSAVLLYLTVAVVVLLALLDRPPGTERARGLELARAVLAALFWLPGGIAMYVWSRWAAWQERRK
jgi:hypothetical protein